MVRVSWRDTDEAPWRGITNYAMKSAGELRSLMAAAFATGQLKHKFYRLDPGQPISRGTASHERENHEGDTTMSKLAQTISGEVKALKHSKADVKKLAKKLASASNVKAISELKTKWTDEVKTKTAAKAAERKAKKEDLRAKKAAAKEVKAKLKAEKKAKKAEARAAAKEAKLKARAEKKAKREAERKSKKNARAERKPKHFWFTAKVGDKELIGGPHDSACDALENISGNRNASGKVAKGCYRSTLKAKDGTKKEFHVMTEQYAKAHGYALPKAAAAVIAETPAPLRRRK